MFIEGKQQMRFAVFFTINGLWPLIVPTHPCAESVPVIYRRELIRHERCSHVNAHISKTVARMLRPHSSAAASLSAAVTAAVLSFSTVVVGSSTKSSDLVDI